MKKRGLLNQPLSNIIAGMGHQDKLAIADAGLPIPLTTTRIDLAIREGYPAFVETLRAVLDEMAVEGAIIAQEIIENSPEMYAALQELLGDIPIQTIPHDEFKQRTESVRAVVRTGEFTPFANVILVAGVVF
jgi:D-ribose pyranase